jgi:hypothetical protein
MAIYQINEVKAQQIGSWSSDATRTYLRILQCLSNDPNDDSETVLSSVLSFLGITQGALAIIYECGNGIDPFAYLKKITVRQDTQKKGEYVNWEARLDYDSTLQQLPDNPLLRPTIVNGSSQMYQKAVEKDVNGKAILNAANKKLEGIEIDDARPHVTMTRNEVDYSWSYFANNLVNWVNSAPWYGCNAGQAKCMDVKGQGPNTENNVTFFTVTYEFQFRAEGWLGQYQNRGRYQIDGAPCIDKNNIKLDEPGFLYATGNNKGFQIPPAQVTTDIVDQNLVKVQHYFTTDFNELGLP